MSNLLVEMEPNFNLLKVCSLDDFGGC